MDTVLLVHHLISMSSPPFHSMEESSRLILRPLRVWYTLMSIITGDTSISMDYSGEIVLTWQQLMR